MMLHVIISTMDFFSLYTGYKQIHDYWSMWYVSQLLIYNQQLIYFYAHDVTFIFFAYANITNQQYIYIFLLCSD